MRAFWGRYGFGQGAPPEKELLGEPELRALPRMDAEGEVRMAERSSRASSWRILHTSQKTVIPSCHAGHILHAMLRMNAEAGMT